MGRAMKLSPDQWPFSLDMTRTYNVLIQTILILQANIAATFLLMLNRSALQAVMTRREYTRGNTQRGKSED
jgi:hypothetical protein